MTTTFRISTKDATSINVTIIRSSISIVSRAGVQSVKHSVHITGLLTTLQKIALLINYSNDFSIHFFGVKYLQMKKEYLFAIHKYQKRWKCLNCRYQFSYLQLPMKSE